MKSILNINESSKKIDLSNNFLTSNSDFVINTDVMLDAPELILKINSQFNLIYKENKKRKYLLAEISNYLVKK